MKTKTDEQKREWHALYDQLHPEDRAEVAREMAKRLDRSEAGRYQSPALAWEFVTILQETAQDTVHDWLTQHGIPQVVIDLVSLITSLEIYVNQANSGQVLRAFNGSILEDVQLTVNAIAEIGGTFHSQHSESNRREPVSGHEDHGAGEGLAPSAADHSTCLALRRIAPLTEKGVKAFKHAGRKSLITEILDALKKLPLDDVARLNLLTTMLTDERQAQKQPVVQG